MQLKLKSMTQSEDPNMSPSDLLSYLARVSNPSNQENYDTADKLIRYLLKKSHWSPFEMIDKTFEVKTTRDIGRQILRHRSFSLQEFSQRYAEVDISMFEDRECRIQDTKNRQSSYPTKNEHLLNSWQHNIDNVKKACGDVYKLFMNLGFAKEQARAVLPEGLTPSTMYMKGSIRSWFHFCLVRCHPGTQKEHRDIADAVWVVMQEKFEFFRELDMQKLSIRYQEVFEEILKECTNEL